MRYVLLKHGFAVSEVRRTLAGAESARSGPDVFTADFVRSHMEDELLILTRDEAKDSFTWKRIHAESYPMGGASRRASILRRGWTALRLGFEMWRWHPDRIVCGCTLELLWVSAIVAKLRNAELVLTLHGQLSPRAGIGRIASALDRAIIRSCVGVACHGPFLRDQIRALGVAAHRTHEFEVDLADFAATPENSPPPPLERFAARFSVRIAYLGRMQRDKGIFDLFEAFNMLPSAVRADVGLVYVGDGPDLTNLERQVGARTDDNVLLLGKLAHRDLPGVLRSTTVVVTPTRPELGEGRCMAALEALALGVPVIAPNFGAFPYAIKDGFNGLLFEPGSVAALASCLERVAREEGLVARLRCGAIDAFTHPAAMQQSFSKAIDSAFASGSARR